jgi:hypothetical protein
MKFLPVLAFDGASMNVISAQDVLDITYAGTSATLLAKRWQTALLVHVDNDTLKRLQDKPELLEALKNIEGFRSLNQEIETIINRSEAIKKAKKEDDKKDKKEKKEISEQEKEVKSLRKQVQENLLKLAARIPSFMYLTEYREQTLKDIITKLEPELFKKVTGLSVETFDALCEIGLFDPEKMNQGIFGFRRYESSSLNYTGIDMHEGEDVGGWDTVLKRQEFDELYANQQATMSLQSAILSAFGGSDEPEAVVEKKVEAKPEPTTKPTVTTVAITQKYNVPSQQRNATAPTPVQKPKVEIKIPDVKIGDEVKHKTFGTGTISFMDKAQKKLRVKFAAGEKVFVYPNAFIDGFLQAKE